MIYPLSSPKLAIHMEAFFISMLTIAIGELGDKTQLLACMMASQLRRPLPILFGMLIATLVNHTLAALLGQWVTEYLPPYWLHIALGFTFFTLALWSMLPDKTNLPHALSYHTYSIIFLSMLTFFLAEMGDKTQLATMALAAKYPQTEMVIAGSTLGMLLADTPVVLLGHLIAPQLSSKWIRLTTAILFIILGVLAFYQ